MTGKPVYAEVTRIFRFTGVLSSEEVVEQVADQASSDGWTGDRFTETGFVRMKEIDGRQGSLSVAVAPRDGENHLILNLQLQ